MTNDEFEEIQERHAAVVASASGIDDMAAVFAHEDRGKLLAYITGVRHALEQLKWDLANQDMGKEPR